MKHAVGIDVTLGGVECMLPEKFSDFKHCTIFTVFNYVVFRGLPLTPLTGTYFTHRLG